MATIKYVFFFLTLSTFLGAYHARHLHDISIHEIFDRLSTFQATTVIQMVTGPRRPPRPPGAPPQGQTTLNTNCEVPSIEELTEFPTSLPQAKPKPAPSQGQTTYGADNTKSNSEFPTSLPQAKPKPAPSQGQTTYGVDNTDSNSDNPSTEDLADILATKPTSSMDKIMYGRIEQRVRPLQNQLN